MVKPRIVPALVAGALVALAAGSPAAAQELKLGEDSEPVNTIVRPPKADPPGSSRTWLYVIIFLVGGGAAVGIAVMPSKRTHQD